MFLSAQNKNFIKITSSVVDRKQNLVYLSDSMIDFADTETLIQFVTSTKEISYYQNICLNIIYINYIDDIMQYQIHKTLEIVGIKKIISIYLIDR